jgi:D-amino-acid dehydrogenase
MSEILVIGGGLVGMSAAYRAIVHGAKVTVIDQCDEGKATNAGAGILCPGSSYTNDNPLLPLLKAAHAYYPELRACLADDDAGDLSYAKTGGIQVAVTDEEAGKLVPASALLKSRFEDGFQHLGQPQLIDGSQARSLFPLLSDVKAAIYLPDVARVDGKQFCQALRKVVLRRGATSLSGRVSLFTDDDRVGKVMVDGKILTADSIIIAAGAWSASLAKQIGIDIPLYPQRGQIMHVSVRDTETGTWPIVVNQPTYIVPFPSGKVVIGATREDGSGFDPRNTLGGFEEIIREGLRLADGLRNASFEEIRVGLRPVCPDSLPVLGKAPGMTNVYLATGHGRFGLQAGPHSGALVADLALGKTIPVDIAGFSAARFSSTA